MVRFILKLAAIDASLSILCCAIFHYNNYKSPFTGILISLFWASREIEMKPTIQIIQADYKNTRQSADVVSLLNQYAKDPMGGNKPLSDEVKRRLVPALAELPHAFSILCYVDGQPAGLVNCFEGFSTFKCKPLIYIHDVVVIPEFRGLSLSQKMLAEIEIIARQKNCCKITLEVLEGNTVAKKAYQKFGFSGYELDPEMGKALFWEKAL